MTTSDGFYLFILIVKIYFFVEIKYLSKCQCQSHLSTQLIDRTYSMSVQRLFDYIFGADKDFLVAYHASRRIKGLFFLFLHSFIYLK